MLKKFILVSHLAVFLLIPMTAPAEIAARKSELVFVAAKMGILAYRMNPDSGKVVDLGVAGEVANPGFLAVHPGGRFLYSVNSAKIGGKNVGVVSAFSVDAQTGRLTLLGQKSSEGENPTHLAVDKDGKNVLVANYGSGSVAVFPIGPDGALRTVSARIQHHGSSVDAARQEGPHAHSILPDPASRFALTCDLGLDQVLIYKFNPANGSLAANNPAFASVKPGAGPRHFVFAPGGKSLYVINELDSTMTGFAYDSKRGALREFQTLSTLPRDFRGKSFAAEVAVHPSGKFLYGSNRGHDSIAVFGLEKKTGRLSLVEHQSTGGKTPRHFEIDPAGKFLLAANQDSGTIASFRIDAKTGKLLPLGVVIETEGPECVKFLPAD